MVNESFREDILSFGIPVIVLGDLNQLPPVIGRPAFLINPDYRLTMVMRQVEGHPIIKLSQMAIKGQYIKHGKYGDGTYVIPKQMVTNKLMKSSDIIICGRNSTRQNIINHYRKEILGLDTSIKNFVVGEKLICRQNNWGLELIPDSGIYLTNGMIGTVEAIDLSSYNKRSINMSFKPEFSDVLFDNVGMDFKYLFTDVELAPEVRFATDNKFQFAYAITAHLSQGSQYDNVLIIDERLGSRDFYSKWLYTCLTRARRGLALAKD